MKALLWATMTWNIVFVWRGLPEDCKNPQQADTILRQQKNIKNGSTSASAIALDSDETVALTSNRY